MHEITHSIIEALKNTIMITGFVLAMMLIIEYVNVHTKGAWLKPLQKSGWLQVLLAGILGIIPGCLGAYTVVSLYTHNVMSFGALVTAMIATSGDEAFVMFSMIPETALYLTVIIFFIALLAGFITNFAFRRKTLVKYPHVEFPLHKEEIVHFRFGVKSVLQNFRHIKFHRALLIASLILVLLGLLTGEIGHSHGHEESHNRGWVTITFLICSGIALFIVTTVPNHFLEEHLWDHIIKKHFLKIFLWTFGALVVINVLMEFIPLESWIENHLLIVLGIAVVIGIIPESGPHLVFITLFFNGTIPFSILLANSIVQDGHGALPLFAESKRSFVWMKAINMAVGSIVGMAGYWMGW